MKPFLQLTPAPILALAVLLASAMPVQAQQGGEPVPPPVSRPLFDPPSRDGEVMVRPNPADHGSASRMRNEAVVDRFRDEYIRHNRPRIAVYWNQQLDDTLSQWHGTSRIVTTTSGGFNETGAPPRVGETSASPHVGSSTGTTVMEPQVLVGSQAPGRVQPSESWEWEFQDGFLAPLFQAGAVVVDRAAIIRFTAARPGSTPVSANGPQTIEAAALQGMADLLVEVLMAPSSQSTTGYELHARVLETATGRVLATVNSRGMAGWGDKDSHGGYVANEHGFQKPGEAEADKFGPVAEADKPYRTSGHGFTKQNRPPRVRVIAQQLSLNVMNGLADVWQH
ncbi:MAG: hypothetical protein HQL37_01825 [Alphaproteobacteria bacterium]|nr:hypothetical protein [Alphaproteobacteria bacterium]